MYTHCGRYVGLCKHEKKKQTKKMQRLALVSRIISVGLLRHDNHSAIRGGFIDINIS